MNIIDEFESGDIVKHFYAGEWPLGVVKSNDFYRGGFRVVLSVKHLAPGEFFVCYDYPSGHETPTLKKFYPTELEKLVLAIPKIVSYAL